MANVITLGKRLLPVEQIALVEPFAPSSNPNFKPEKEFKARIVLLSRGKFSSRRRRRISLRRTPSGAILLAVRPVFLFRSSEPSVRFVLHRSFRFVLPRRNVRCGATFRRSDDADFGNLHTARMRKSSSLPEAMCRAFDPIGAHSFPILSPTPRRPR